MSDYNNFRQQQSEFNRAISYNGNGYNCIYHEDEPCNCVFFNQQQHSQTNGYFNNSPILYNNGPYSNEHLQYPAYTITNNNSLLENYNMEFSQPMQIRLNGCLPNSSGHICLSVSRTCTDCWMFVCPLCEGNHDQNKIMENPIIYRTAPSNQLNLQSLCIEQVTKVKKVLDHLHNIQSRVDTNYLKANDEIKVLVDPIRDALEDLVNNNVKHLENIRNTKINCIENHRIYLCSQLQEFSAALRIVQTKNPLNETEINMILNTIHGFQKHYAGLTVPSDAFIVNINDPNGYFDQMKILCANAKAVFDILTYGNTPISRRICNTLNGNRSGLFTSTILPLEINNNQVSNSFEMLERYVGKCVPDSCKEVNAIDSVSHYFRYFANEGKEPGKVCRPWGLCADKDGNIIISDRRNHRIQVFDSKFQLITIFGSAGSENGQFKLPAGVTTTPLNEIAVVDKDNHRVQIFSKHGEFLRKFGSQGIDAGKFSYPWGIACNSIGEMAVTDSKNGRLQLFSPEGLLISIFNFDNPAIDKRLMTCSSPRGVCFTRQGNLLVTDFEHNKIHVLRRCNAELFKTEFGPGTGIFSRPSGIACDDFGNVVIADSKHQLIIVYGRNCQQKFNIDLTTLQDPKLRNDRPSDVTILPNGNIAVILEPSPDSKDKNVDPNKPHVLIFLGKGEKVF